MQFRHHCATQSNHACGATLPGLCGSHLTDLCASCPLRDSLTARRRASKTPSRMKYMSVSSAPSSISTSPAFGSLTSTNLLSSSASASETANHLLLAEQVDKTPPPRLSLKWCCHCHLLRSCAKGSCRLFRNTPCLGGKPKIASHPVPTSPRPAPSPPGASRGLRGWSCVCSPIPNSQAHVRRWPDRSNRFGLFHTENRGRPPIITRKGSANIARSFQIPFPATAALVSRPRLLWLNLCAQLLTRGTASVGPGFVVGPAALFRSPPLQTEEVR